MNDVVRLALRNDRSYIIDQMIQNFEIDRDCQRRHIVISDAEIDEKIAQLRKALAPTTLDQALKQHHATMAEVRGDFRRSIARMKLVENEIPPTKMVRCRAILIKFCPAGVPEAVCSSKRTEPEALAAVKDVQDQIKQGKDFADVAAQYSEMTSPDKKGDIGILFDGIRNVDEKLVSSAVSLNKGEVGEPFKMTNGFGYCILQAVSTNDDHPKGEAAAYAAATRTYHDNSAQFYGPKYVVNMIDHSKIWLLSDADLLSGKPLPKAAATVDGHAILMKDVIAKCMAADGPRCTDMLVESYVVNRECKRRGITVAPAEIDSRIDELKKEIAPHTIDEALKMHHTTMAQLREDFEQDIERTKLVEGEVKPTKMVHCRLIMVKDTDAQPNATQPIDYTGKAESTDAPAPVRSIIEQIQAELKAGTDFAALAKKYAPAGADGDLGVLFQGEQAIDTAVLNAGLSLKKGEITAQPVKAVDGWCLLQAVSTSDDHPADENAAYDKAREIYKEQEAQMRIPQYVTDLIKKSKVVYYVHA
jgi:parvulin-like peptidyl-prolyl isomerase